MHRKRFSKELRVTPRRGVVAASSPNAAAAGASMFELGGNAADAAVATCFALCVCDPANTSIMGRSHALVVLRDGTHAALDGATETPASVASITGPDDRREGFAVVPLPGNPKALPALLQRFGRLSLEATLAPAIRLAELGFVPPERLADIWRKRAGELSRDEGASRHLLGPDRCAPGAVRCFAQPALGAFLRRFATQGASLLERGDTAASIEKTVSEGGGYLSARGMKSYAPRDGEVLSTFYRGWEVVTVGRQAWGHTLVEMLNILEHFEVSRSPDAAIAIALVIAVALEDRPQELGTLRPKPAGLPFDRLADAELAAERAAEIRACLARPRALMRRLEAVCAQPQWTGDRDTTHLSVLDAEGNAVSMTTSIGPHFGAKVASRDEGLLFAYSYRMAVDPTPGARDQTEMSPAVLLRDGRPVLAVGGAGSERIPGAVLQVIANVVDLGLGLGDAVSRARLNWKDGRLRVHEGFPADALTALERSGFPVEITGRGHENHLGIVHAAGIGEGAADPAYDGAAVAAA